jgi:hypothetical protein
MRRRFSPGMRDAGAAIKEAALRRIAHVGVERKSRCLPWTSAT